MSTKELEAARVAVNRIPASARLSRRPNQAAAVGPAELRPGTGWRTQTGGGRSPGEDEGGREETFWIKSCSSGKVSIYTLYSVTQLFAERIRIFPPPVCIHFAFFFIKEQKYC